MKKKKDMIISVAFLAVLGVSCFYVLGGTQPEVERPAHRGYQNVDWIWNDYQLVMRRAQTEKKYVLIDFWAVWCKECKEMDRKAFEDSEIQHLLENFVCLKVDVDDVPQLKARFLVVGMPTVVVLTADGEEVARVVGYQDTIQMQEFLEKVLTGKE